MEASMKHVFLAAVALSASVLALSPAPAMDMHKIIKADAIQWAPAPPQLPKGSQIAVVYGDPGKEGLYIILARMPDAYAIPAHWHNQVENVTVLSGTFNVGMGDKLDKTKGQALGPGSFFSSGAKMNHFAWVTGETVIQVTGLGPLDITYVDPKDDPSTMAKK
jgi:hypothetical protein